MTHAPAFSADLSRGHLGEEAVARWLAKRYVVRRATDEEDRAGVDLWIQPGRELAPVAVQVKTRLDAGDKFFVETHRMAQGLPAPGWALSESAHLFAILDEKARFTILIRPAALRRRIPLWLEGHGQAQGRLRDRNRGRSRGVWVEWHELHAAGRLYWLAGPAPRIWWREAHLHVGAAGPWTD